MNKTRFHSQPLSAIFLIPLLSLPVVLGHEGKPPVATDGAQQSRIVSHSVHRAPRDSIEKIQFAFLGNQLPSQLAYVDLILTALYEPELLGDEFRFNHEEMTALGLSPPAGEGPFFLLGKCGTPMLRAVDEMINNAPQAKRDSLRETLMSRKARETYNLELTFPSPEGHFLIHYSVDPSDEPDTVDSTDTIDHGQGSGTFNDFNAPDVVEQYAAYCDTAWSSIVGTDALHFEAPPTDGSAGGGTDLLDVYIADIGTYGITSKLGDAVWIHVDNTNTDNLMRVTVAHEFFHCVQASYDWSENLWIIEGTAMFAEDTVYDDVNDYISYSLNDHLSAPDTCLVNDSNDGYSAILYWKYAAEHYGTDGDGNPAYTEYGTQNKIGYDDNGIDFIKELWVACVSYNGIDALEAVLDSHGSSFQLSFEDWLETNYLKDLADPYASGFADYLEDENGYASIWVAGDYELTGSESIHIDSDVQRWGADFYRFTPLPSVEQVEFQFNGGGIGGDEFCALHIIGVRADTTLDSYVLTPDYYHNAQQTVVNDGFQQIVLIIAGADSDFGGENYVVEVVSSGSPGGDVVPPAVDIEHPLDGETVSGIVTIIASASDDTGVAHLQVIVAGALWCDDYSAPYSCEWDSSGFVGPVVLQAIAYDAAGNFGTDQVTVIVEEQASQGISLACSPPAVPVDGESFATLTATVTDGSGGPLSGVPVTFQLNAGTYGQWVDASGQAVSQPNNGPTDSQGRRCTYFRPSEPNTTCSFTVSIPGDSATCSFEATPPSALDITITARLLGLGDGLADYRITAGFKYPNGEPVENGTAEFITTVGYWLNGSNPGGQTTQRDMSASGVADANLRVFATGPGDIRACYVEGEVCSSWQEFTFSIDEPAVIESVFSLAGPHNGMIWYLDVGYNYLAALEYDQALTVWDMNTWSVVRNWNKSDFSPDLDGWALAECLSVSSNDQKVVVPHWQTIAIFDIVTGLSDANETPWQFTPEEDCDWKQATSLWATVDVGDGGEGIDLYNGLSHCRDVDVIDGSMKAVAWSPDGARIAYTYRDFSVSPLVATLRIREAPTCSSSGTIKATLPLATGTVVGGVTWSPNGQCVAASDGGGSIRIFNRDGGSSGCTPSAIPLPSGGRGALKWSPDGQHIAAVCGVDGVVLVDANNGILAAMCNVFPDMYAKDVLGWRADGQVLAVSVANTTQIRVFAPFDSEAPDLEISSPADGSYTFDPQVQVTGMAEDGLAYGLVPNSLKWQVDSGGWNGVPFPSSGGPFSFTVPLTEGLHTLALQVGDLAGHATSRSIQIERRLMPWIVTAGVSNTNPLQGESITVWATVSDGGFYVSDAVVTGLLESPTGMPIELSMPYDGPDLRYEAQLFCTQQGTYSGEVHASGEGMADGVGVLPDILVSNAPPDTSITSSFPADGQHIVQTTLSLTWIGIDTGTPTADLTYSWKLDGDTWSSFSPVTNTTLADLSLGQHTFYVRSYDGSLADPSPATRSFVVSPDCNNNGTPDETDIGSGYSTDCNDNGVPDDCEPGVRFGDFNGDCSVGPADVEPFMQCLHGPSLAYGAGCVLADGDTDGDCDLVDFALLQRLFVGGCDADWSVLPVTGPSARYGSAMAYVPELASIVLFGGRQYVNGTWESTNDMWVWNGQEWSLDSRTAPPARDNHMLVWDGANAELVLFGGITWTGSGTFRDDTWTWTPADGWTPKDLVVKPSARLGAAMVFDAVRNRVVLFGGSGSGNCGDTWEWDGTTWDELDELPQPRPSARYLHGMAFDSVKGVTVLFGGFGAGGNYNDTWTFNGIAWTQQTLTNTPSKRRQHVLVYDAARQRTVLFGGNTTETAALSDTWEWNGSNWNWEEVTTTPQQPRGSAAAAYDAQYQQSIVFGGLVDTGRALTVNGETLGYACPP